MPVYLIRAGLTGDVKIGVAKDPVRRLQLIQTSHPVKLRFLRLLEGEHAEEALLHKRFAALRKVGEWFGFCEEMASGDLGLPSLPLPKKRSFHEWPDNAQGRYRRMRAELLEMVGGVEAFARRVGEAPWDIEDWPGLSPKWFSAAVLVARENGYRAIGVDDLLAAMSAAAAEKQAIEAAAPDPRQKYLLRTEINWIKKHGIDKAWWPVSEAARAAVADAPEEVASAATETAA